MPDISSEVTEGRVKRSLIRYPKINWLCEVAYRIQIMNSAQCSLRPIAFVIWATRLDLWQTTGPDGIELGRLSEPEAALTSSGDKPRCNCL